MSSSIDCEVLVIGGGFSGVSAAASLIEKGVDCHLLEARDRVGGRTYTIKTSDDQWVDMGGAYVGPQQHRLLKAAHSVGVKSEPVNADGDLLVNFKDGSSVAYSGSIPALPLLTALDFNRVICETERARATIDINQPWTATDKGRMLDSLTMEQWIVEHVDTEHGREFYRALIRSLVCAEPHEVSALFWLNYVNGCEGFHTMTGMVGAAQERHFSGGMQPIATALMNKRVGTDRTHFNAHVQSVDWSAEKVTVKCVDGRIFTANRVIAAISPALYSTIQWSPAMVSQKATGAARQHMGTVLKTVMRYSTPWWRSNGWNGSLIQLDATSPIGFSYDDCHDAEDGKPRFYALMGFCYGDASDIWRAKSLDERRAGIVEQYAASFGDKAREHTPIDYMEQDWCAEPLSRGCYGAVCGPGVLTTMREALRTPMGAVHFAGTELAYQWSGYINGAIESGERAAFEVLQALGKVGADEKFQLDEPVNEEWDCQRTPIQLVPTQFEYMLPRARTVKWIGYSLSAIATVSAIVGTLAWWQRKVRR